MNLPILVIGSGPAGYVCAIRLAQLGKRVVILEKDAIGGVCLNRGCIPSKALITAGHFFEKIAHAQQMGIHTQGVSLDFQALFQWKDRIVHKLTQGVESLLKAHNITILTGTAHFTTKNTLTLTHANTSKTLTFEHCVIATGSHPIGLPFLPIDHKTVLDSTSALSLPSQPTSLLCVGGGYIGLELGIFYAKIGTQVTVIEATSQLLGQIDQDIHQVLLKRIKALGITVHCHTQITDAHTNEKGITLIAKNKAQPHTPMTFKASHALLTIGRKPQLESLQLEKAGIHLDASGFIFTHPNGQTQNPQVFAIGDVTGQPMLAHKGSAQAMITAEAIAGKKTTWNHAAIASVIFTDPEIASVGLTETQAQQQGIPVEISTFPFAANGRALSLNEPLGFVKILSETGEKKGRLLGIHIIGAEASQLISEAALALEMGAYLEDLALTIHPHPTLSEAIMEAAHVGLGHGIHIFKPQK